MNCFWDHVDAPEGEPDACWIWRGPRTGNGYGSCRMEGRMVGAHRVSYEIHKGPIPEGLQLDHLCRTRACVNPGHLEAVTTQENTRRGESGRNHREKTHCPQGHPFAGDNLYVHPNGGRKCRACRRKRQNARDRDQRLRLATALAAERGEEAS